MRHPGELELALYASSDLALWRRLAVGWHVRRCAHCRRELERLCESALFLKDAATEMPADVHWGRLSAEMRANIKLGLEAGAIAGPVDDAAEPPARPMGWRIAAAVASVTVLTISGLWLHMPRPVARPGSGDDQTVVLKSTRSGIEVADSGGSLALMHRASERVTLTVGTRGELGARYVDDETGEVTIHHVYAE